jgi:hypothetical protein
MVNMKLLLLSLLFLLLSGCGNEKKPDAKTFHLGSGVNLISARECDPNLIGKAPEITKSDNKYVISIYDARVCNVQSENPTLSLTRSKKATLDVGDSTCECARMIQVGIEGRLETGDTVYVLNGGEVSDHLRVP